MPKARRLSEAEIRERIGARLRQLRGERTQADLAKELGVSASYISAVEVGASKPSLELLMALSERYGVSIDWLLTGRHTESGVEGSMDPDVSEFEVMLHALRRMYRNADDETRAWFRVQLRRAFPELDEMMSDTKKQQSAAG